MNTPSPAPSAPKTWSVQIASAAAHLSGDLLLPATAQGIVVFSHGSGSSRQSPRNRFVAEQLREVGLGTLLFDLLTPDEDRSPGGRFDIDLLTARLADAVRFVREHRLTRELPLGLFGASTGAAGALRVAAAFRESVAAVVSRGGRPDLAGRQALRGVRAATLLVVGGLDTTVIDLNRAAAKDMTHCECELSIVPGATHLFEEPGTLEAMTRLAQQWFAKHLLTPRPQGESNEA
jgi:putative phosphoribosyl transferase